MNMRKLLAGVVCAGVAASIALGVRNQLTEKATVEHEVAAPAEPVRAADAGDHANGVPVESLPPDTPVNSRAVGPAAPAATPDAPAAAVSMAREPAAEHEASVPAQEDGNAILQRAAAAYRNVRSMRADFTQVQQNPLLRREITSRGTFFQQQPDKFLMRFSEPAGDVVVGDGQYFWVYYPSHDAKQVIRLPASVGQGVDLQSQFIGDPTKRFRHTLHGKEEVGGRRASVLTLVPTEPAGYRSLKVWIDDEDSLIRRFVLTNDNGVVQNFSLSNLQVNPKLDPAIFRFTPPAGATIIER